MQAVILAGGLGTRLRPYTTTLPKPLVPVGGVPILAILLTQLQRAGCRRAILAVHHRAELIKRFVGGGERFGLDVDYSVEPLPLGTVGPLALIPDLPESFLVMNGDLLTDLDFAEFFAFHQKGKAELSVATYQLESAVEYGVLTLGRRGSVVKAFREKPRTCITVSMGVYAFRRALLDRIPRGQPYGVDQLIMDMLANRKQIAAYPFRGYWQDLGRPDDFDRANLDIERISSLRSCVDTSLGKPARKRESDPLYSSQQTQPRGA